MPPVYTANRICQAATLGTNPEQVTGCPQPEQLGGSCCCFGADGPALAPHGSTVSKWLIEQAKMRLSTESGLAYYYHQVKRFT